MPFGPRKGEKYTIPAKKVVKFRLSKAAKDAIVGPTPPARHEENPTG
jgi:nucleoid DNA-binding protein